MALAMTQSAALGPFPDSDFGRVCEGFSRAVKYLRPEAENKLRELLDPKTIFAFVAILALLAGINLIPFVGVAADYLVATYGAYQLGSSYLELLSAVREAAAAESSEALEVAAQHIARGLNDSVIDTMLAFAGSFGFRKLKGMLEPLASRFMPAKLIRRAPASKPSEPAKPVEEPGKKGLSKEPAKVVEEPPTKPGESILKDYLIGAGEAVALEHAALDINNALNRAKVVPIVVGVVGVGLAAGLTYWALKRKRASSRRSSNAF